MELGLEMSAFYRRSTIVKKAAGRGRRGGEIRVPMIHLSADDDGILGSQQEVPGIAAGILLLMGTVSQDFVLLE